MHNASENDSIGLRNCNAELLLRENKVATIIDARSESEFLKGHVPGSLNIPLLSDSERSIIGKCYKEKGRLSAIDLGFQLLHPKQDELVERARSLLPKDGPQYVYCARGGMRSHLLAWFLKEEVPTFDPLVVYGGYKSFRQFAISVFETNPMDIVVIAGRTGSGKTKLLQELANDHQVLDLEEKAQHSGSAFGLAGWYQPQPSNEQFSNNLALQWLGFDSEKIVFIEDEGRSVGHVQLPEPLFNKLRNAKLVIDLEVPLDVRIENLVQVYAGATNVDDDFFIRAVDRISKRLGNERSQDAKKAILRKDYSDAARILLHYYDKKYTTHLMNNRSASQIVKVDWGSELVQKVRNTYFSNSQRFSKS